MKIGNNVVCKDFPRNVNDTIRTEDTNIIIDRSYKVIDVSHPVKDENGLTVLEMLTIIGENGECSYWSDYFYTKKEERKRKLKKLNRNVK